MNFYNEHDRNAAAWLEELVWAGDLPPGQVDARDVQDVGAMDSLHRYDQCHFFAGIGGWPYALDLAGWPRDKPIWTASLPCQPFSDAGKQLGAKDDRHLWPSFRELIDLYRPQYVVGEQVASKAGRAWFASLQLEMEDLGYRVGAIDLCAAGIGAPHIRQRLFWCAIRVGITNGQGRDTRGNSSQTAGHGSSAGSNGSASGLPNPMLHGLDRSREAGTSRRPEPANRSNGDDPWANVVYIPCSDWKARPIKSSSESVANGLPGCLVQSSDSGTSETGDGEESEAQTSVAGWPTPNTTEGGLTSRSGDRKGELLVGGIARGITAPLDHVAIPPLVSVPAEDLNNTNEARAMRLRGYGNAIVAPLAAEFIKTFMEIIECS